MQSETLLFDCCQRLLEVTVDAMDDPPDLTFVADGDPMQSFADCPMVAVSMMPNGLFQTINVVARGPSLPARPTTKTAIRQGIFGVWVISTNCYPVMTAEGGVPDGDLITAAARQVLVDRQRVWDELRDQASAGTLFDGVLVNGNNGASVEPPTTAWGPQGRIAGSVIRVYADLLALAPSS